MSALDFPARALAQQALLQSPVTYQQLCNRNLPVGVQRIDSSGYQKAGVGAGTYVADELATQALATAHPGACFKGDGGRYFRLLPDAQGYITPEQLGCPQYAPGVNARPHIQAAIDFGHAMRKHGIKGVVFGQSTYEVWTPLRAPGMNHGTPYAQMNGGPNLPMTDPRSTSGFPFVVRRRIALRAAPSGTTLIRRKFDGSDPAVFAGTQALDPHYQHGTGFYWRGGMFLLVGLTYAETQLTPDYNDRPGIDFEGKWKLSGGIPWSKFPGQYYEAGDYARGKLQPGTGFGWDWSDKAIWFCQLGNNGDLTFDELEIDGFRGEDLYQGGDNGSIVGRKLTISNTDADLFNPSPRYHSDGKPGRLNIEELTLSEGFQALEGGSGAGDAYIGKLTIKNVDKGGHLNGGSYNGEPDKFTWQPSFKIGSVYLDNAGSFAVCERTTIGEIFAKDTGVNLSGSLGNCWNSNIGRITFTTDAKTISQLYIAGFGGTAGTNGERYPPQDVYVGEIAHVRTPAARAANRYSKSMEWAAGAHFGPNIRVGAVTGDYGSAPNRSGGNEPTGYIPTVEAMRGYGGASAVHPVDTTPVMTSYTGWCIRLSGGTSGANLPLTLPNPEGKVNNGARLRLIHYTNGMVVSVQTNNTRMNRRVMLLPSVQYDFEVRSNRWELVSNPAVLTGAGTATFQKGGAAIPAGDVSDEVMLTVLGARPGMDVRVTHTATLPTDIQLLGRVSANDTVAIRARNLNLASTLALASGNYRVALDWPN